MDRERDRRPPIPLEDRYGNTRGQSYRPNRSPPPGDGYRSLRSPPRGHPYDSYAPRGPLPPRGRSRSPPPFRRRSRSPPPFRRGGDSFVPRTRSPPRREFPRDDLFSRGPPPRDFRDEPRFRERSPRGAPPINRSPIPLKRSRDVSPVSSRGRVSPPPAKRERLSPTRSRFGDYPPSRDRRYVDTDGGNNAYAYKESPPRRKFSPMRERRPSPPRGFARDFRPTDRSSLHQVNRVDPRTVDDWRRRSPSPRKVEHVPADNSGRESATTSRRSSPPIHPSRLIGHNSEDRPTRPPMRDEPPIRPPPARSPLPASPRRRESPPPRERELPPNDRGFPPRNRELPPRERDFAPRDREFPARERELPPSGRDMAPRERDMPPRERDMPPRERPTEPSQPPREQEPQPTDRDVVMKDQDLPPTRPPPSSSAPRADDVPPTRPPPTGPGASRAAPTGPDTSPPTGPRGPPTGPRPSAPSIPSAPRGAPPPRGGYSSRGDFAPRGRGSYSTTFRGRGAFSGPPPRTYPPNTTPSSTTDDTTPTAPPSGPRASLNRIPSTTRGRGFGPALDRKPGINPYLASLPIILDGGQRAPDLYDRNRLDKLEEDAERLRRLVDEKQVRKRRGLREWERLEREARVAGLRSELAEDAVGRISGEVGGGGAAF